MTLGKFRQAYTIAAIIFLNTVLLFAALNLAIQARRSLRSLRYPSMAWGVDTLSAAYPGWRNDDLLELTREGVQANSFRYDPIAQFRLNPFQGRYVNVDERGFRKGKMPAPWPPDPAALNIFVFGGSTTFGDGVTDAETIPAAIEDHARSARCSQPVHVYNLGQPYYFSTQESLLFYSLLLQHTTPNVAIFVDGLNDLLFPNGEPAVAQRFRHLIKGDDETPMRELPQKLPVFQALQRFRTDRQKNTRQSADAEPPFGAAIERWTTNKEIVGGLAKSFGVKTLFIWQPVPTYQYDLTCHFLCKKDTAAVDHLRPLEQGYRIVDRLRPRLEQSGDFLWLADMQRDKKENLYVDHVHYNAAFSREIARRILDFMRDRRLLNCGH